MRNPNIDPGIIERARESYTSAQTFAPEGRGQENQGLAISTAVMKKVMEPHVPVEASDSRSKPHTGFVTVGARRHSIVGDRHKRIRHR